MKLFQRSFSLSFPLAMFQRNSSSNLDAMESGVLNPHTSVYLDYPPDSSSTWILQEVDSPPPYSSLLHNRNNTQNYSSINISGSFSLSIERVSSSAPSQSCPLSSNVPEKMFSFEEDPYSVSKMPNSLPSVKRMQVIESNNKYQCVVDIPLHDETNEIRNINVVRRSPDIQGQQLRSNDDIITTFNPIPTITISEVPAQDKSKNFNDFNVSSNIRDLPTNVNAASTVYFPKKQQDQVLRIEDTNETVTKSETIEAVTSINNYVESISQDIDQNKQDQNKIQPSVDGQLTDADASKEVKRQNGTPDSNCAQRDNKRDGTLALLNKMVEGLRSRRHTPKSDKNLATIPKKSSSHDGFTDHQTQHGIFLLQKFVCVEDTFDADQCGVRHFKNSRTFKRMAVASLRVMVVAFVIFFLALVLLYLRVPTTLLVLLCLVMTIVFVGYACVFSGAARHRYEVVKSCV